ncbi:hypothetical protein BDN70DRAFT_91178 [Pholiota conissans]|uniref:Uncharacterized protein n=1 Tax=Pholiota conissans TaxID=109636 RepID=A0A9P5YZ98_9AGAR|nr:hypothetical protein BDN70DRAFT_91178 [Pholiota conissans]
MPVGNPPITKGFNSMVSTPSSIHLYRRNAFRDASRNSPAQSISVSVSEAPTMTACPVNTRNVFVALGLINALCSQLKKASGLLVFFSRALLPAGLVCMYISPVKLLLMINQSHSSPLNLSWAWRSLIPAYTQSSNFHSKPKHRQIIAEARTAKVPAPSHPPSRPARIIYATAAHWRTGRPTTLAYLSQFSDSRPGTLVYLGTLGWTMLRTRTLRDFTITSSRGPVS